MHIRRIFWTLGIFTTLVFPAHAVLTHADSVSENYTPQRISTTDGPCMASISYISDGHVTDGDVSTDHEDAPKGYCPREETLPDYEFSLHYSLGIDEKMKSITVWANAGSIYSDGELQTFDLKVDYVDSNGNSATLTMSNVNIGDTTSANDPKTVLFRNTSGNLVELNGVTAVRISNIGGPTGERAVREIQADVNPDTASSSLAVTKTANPDTNVDVGTVVTYTYVVKNTGNQPITNITLNDDHDGLGTPPVPGNETLSADKGHSGDSSDSTANDGVWDTLAPYDEITLTSTYTVTYRDIEARQ